MTSNLHPNTSSVTTCPPRLLLILSVLLLSAFTVVFWNFLSTQFGFAVTNPGDWGHTLLVPLAVAWLIWARRDELVEHPLRCSRSGLLLVGTGVFLYLLALIGPAIEFDSFDAIRGDRHSFIFTAKIHPQFGLDAFLGPDIEDETTDGGAVPEVDGRIPSIVSCEFQGMHRIIDHGELQGQPLHRFLRC